MMAFVNIMALGTVGSNQLSITTVGIRNTTSVSNFRLKGVEKVKLEFPQKRKMNPSYSFGTLW